METGSNTFEVPSGNEPVPTEKIEEIKELFLDYPRLDVIASVLPIYPPLIPGGEATVADMYPMLTEDELNYVMSVYVGNMQSKRVTM